MGENFANCENLTDYWGNTYEINIENCNSSEMRRIKASETEIFTIKVDKNDVGMPDLLQLRTYVEHIEQLFDIRF